jgi:hypothetical protein
MNPVAIQPANNSITYLKMSTKKDKIRKYQYEKKARTSRKISLIKLKVYLNKRMSTFVFRLTRKVVNRKELSSPTSKLLSDTKIPKLLRDTKRP